ncbi:MAG: HlyD family type I secretion periplasmic adaptor subunit [Betaproteobacteria bacterium]|nr:protease secretion system membrane fusion protein [Azospira oryzae]TLS17609.1 MAG: HlyD family type I secretion periplasmic adaptor subunit [Betaproteobacteria bacterium]
MSLGSLLLRLKTTVTSLLPPPPLADDALPTDTERPLRIGIWGLAIGFGGLLLWATLAPLDEGVPTQGVVSIDTKRKTIQHLLGGRIREVYVKEGQYVQANELLLKLEDANARANYEAVRQHYLSLRSVEGRLLAEQSGATKISFHEDILKYADDPLVRQQMATQEQLLQSRRLAYEAEQQAMREAIRGQEAQVTGYGGMIESRRNQLRLLEKELKSISDLVKQGFMARTRQLELERNAAEVSSILADLNGNLIKSRQGIAEVKMRLIQRQQEYRKEVDTLLADVQRDVQVDEDKLRAVTEELEHTEIRSPVAGQVVGLVTQTVGGVVQAAQRLMDIVPVDEPLLLEAKVPPHLIDRIKVGLPTDVRFTTFAHSPQLLVEGTIQSISADLITENQPSSGQPTSYYLVRISISPEGMKKLGNRNLQPGMAAEVVIKTGERSVLTYLLHPLTKRIAASMKEE